MSYVRWTGPAVFTTGGVGCSPFTRNVRIGVGETMATCRAAVLLVSSDSATVPPLSAMAQKNRVENGVPAGIVAGVLAALDTPGPRPATAREVSSVSAVVHTLSVDRYKPTVNAPAAVPPL